MLRELLLFDEKLLFLTFLIFLAGVPPLDRLVIDRFTVSIDGLSLVLEALFKVPYYVSGIYSIVFGSKLPSYFVLAAFTKLFAVLVDIINLYTVYF